MENKKSLSSIIETLINETKEILDDDDIFIEYKLNRNIKGGCFFEFLPGKYQNKHWNDTSVFIFDIAVVFEDLLAKTNENYREYSHWGITYFNESQVNLLKDELTNRVREINENIIVSGEKFSKGYYKRLNNGISKKREEILTMLEEFIVWLKTIDENDLTIIGV